MSKKKRKDNFMIQAAILAAAGLISRIIGLLYGVPLYRIIGEEGNGYYATAYDIYFLILLISTYSIPIAVSKVISQRLAVNEYKNARKLFYCSMFYVLVVGSITAIITFIFAPYWVVKPSVLALRVMAPTIFFSGLLSVFRGYMQAYNTMTPTAVSQIIEQVINAVVSVVAAYFCSKPFRDVDSSLAASRGAAGSALGTGAGVLAGLSFILLVYAKRKKDIDEKIALDNCTNEESYKDLFKVIFLMVTPVILSTFIYNVSTTIDMKIYWAVMNKNGIATKVAGANYGIYSRQFLVLINVPIAIASAVSSALIPGISGAYGKNDITEVKNKLNQAIRTTMLIIIPATIGMSVLANPIMQLLFHGTTKSAANALTAGSISILFYSLSTITNGVLQAIGKVVEPVKNATITLVIHVLFVYLMLEYTNGILSVLVAGSVIYSFLMCILNARSVRKYLDYKMDLKKIYIMPAIAALAMGFVAYFVYKYLYMVIGSNILCLAISIIVAATVYFVVILKIGGYTEEDIKQLPKGTLIVRIAKKVNLM